MSIILETSWWYILICLAAALTMAGILYFKNEKEQYTKPQKIIMATLRFLSTFLLCFLLLSPIAKNVSEEIENPIIIIASDNSMSMALTKDSGYIKNAFTDKLTHLQEQLSKEGTVETYTFGESTTKSGKLDFKEHISNYSQLFSELNDIYYNRNVGALIIVGDGIYNSGIDPNQAAEKLNFPIYTIATGDTSVKKDLYISKITNNDITYKGNKFPLEIVINAKLLNGKKATASIYKENKQIATQDFEIKGNDFFTVLNFNIPADQKGIQAYKVILSKNDGEFNFENNERLFYIEVLEDKQKIAIAASSPHPDLGALKRSISNNINYSVETFVGQTQNFDPLKYDAIIFHQIPDNSKTHSDKITKAVNQGIPSMFILGQNSNLTEFNKLNTGLTISSISTNINETLPIYDNTFSLFTISKESIEQINKMPPLYAPIGNYQTTASTSKMIRQKIGNYTSELPLITFNQTADNRYCIITGENIWKWRSSTYKQTGSFESFDEIINKSLQYLVSARDKKFFKIKCEHSFLDGENIEINAELYDKNYQPVNTHEVSITITDENGKTFPYIMSAKNNEYYLNAGKYKPGIYKYKAIAKAGNETYTETGEFSVNTVNLENASLTADHKTMANLALKHSGKMLYPSEISELPDILKQRDDFRPVSYTVKTYNDIIGSWWILILIAILLSAEWFLRKRNGGY